MYAVPVPLRVHPKVPRTTVAKGDPDVQQAWKTRGPRLALTAAKFHPGVPQEMERMWREQAVPRLTPYLSGGVIRLVTLHTKRKSSLVGAVNRLHSRPQ